MRIFSFIWKSLLRLLSLVLFIVVVIVLIAYFRIEQHQQADNEPRTANKLQYLESVAAMERGSATRPNIIFILYDDMGYGDIGYGAIGSRMINTPHLDQLAAEE
ncbi:MAG: hypothetical protein ACJAZ0_001411 [Halioglobus sp.]|jgi:hypothetical protein